MQEQKNELDPIAQAAGESREAIRAAGSVPMFRFVPAEQPNGRVWRWIDVALASRTDPYCPASLSGDPPMGHSITVNVVFDAEAKVWWVESSDLPGLHIEADTIEEMRAALPGAVQDLLELDAPESGPRDVPIELIAHTQTQVRIGA